MTSTINQKKVPVRESNRRVTQLTRCDRELWPSGVTRVIQQSAMPRISSRAPNNAKHGALLYRSFYYYSDDEKRPYVALLKRRQTFFPLVYMCSEETYKIFLQKVAAGEFSDCEFTLIPPN